MARAFSYNRSSRNPAASNPTPNGMPQGTMGGPAMPASSKPGRMMLMVGDEAYLWGILFLELGAIAFLRNHFRRYHGG
jgi:hypothetical protein